MARSVDWHNYQPEASWYTQSYPAFPHMGTDGTVTMRSFEPPEGSGWATLDGHSALAELWGTPEGRIFWRLGNWGGFYHCEPLINGGDTVKELPPNAFLLIKDGQWVDTALRSMSCAADEGEFFEVFPLNPVMLIRKRPEDSADLWPWKLIRVSDGAELAATDSQQGLIPYADALLGRVELVHVAGMEFTTR